MNFEEIVNILPEENDKKINISNFESSQPSSKKIKLKRKKKVSIRWTTSDRIRFCNIKEMIFKNQPYYLRDRKPNTYFLCISKLMGNKTRKQIKSFDQREKNHKGGQERSEIFN